MSDIGNQYSYTDPETGAKVVVAGEEQHSDRFAVLRREGLPSRGSLTPPISCAVPPSWLSSTGPVRVPGTSSPLSS